MAFCCVWDTVNSAIFLWIWLICCWKRSSCIIYSGPVKNMPASVILSLLSFSWILDFILFYHFLALVWTSVECTYLSLVLISYNVGASLGLNFNQNAAVTTDRRRGFVVRAAKKYQLCQTKRNRSRKSLARTHGFRKRMRTTSGRAVIKRRRAKGRWNLCPKSNPNSGKRA